VQVLAGSNDRVDSSLAAFISLHQSARELRAEQVAAELRNTLDGMLPKQMVPAFIHVLPELPRLPNGKIDRRGLAELRNSPSREYVAPRNALESVLADFMAKLLGIDRMSATESFLAAGGNSLLVIKLVARIRQQFDVEIPPGIVFDRPTPAALAGALLEHEIAADRLRQQAELLVAH
jgi:acyl carrier protein